MLMMKQDVIDAELDIHLCDLKARVERLLLYDGGM
jgi:hypothetical protein